MSPDLEASVARLRGQDPRSKSPNNSVNDSGNNSQQPMSAGEDLLRILDGHNPLPVGWTHVRQTLSLSLVSAIGSFGQLVEWKKSVKNSYAVRSGKVFTVNE